MLIFYRLFFKKKNGTQFFLLYFLYNLKHMYYVNQLV